MNCFQEKGILFLVILFCGAIHNSFAMQITLPDGDYEGEELYFQIKSGELSLGKKIERPPACLFSEEAYNDLKPCLFKIESYVLQSKDPNYLCFFKNQAEMKLVRLKHDEATIELLQAKKKFYRSHWLWLFPLGIIAYAQQGFVSDEYKKWVYCFGIAVGLTCCKVCLSFCNQMVEADKMYTDISSNYSLLSNNEYRDIKTRKIDYLNLEYNKLSKYRSEDLADLLKKCPQ